MPPVAQLASRLTPRGWLILGGGAAAAILFVYLFLQMVSAPGYSTLISGVNPAQTGKMTSTLSARGIGYQLQNNGTALAVQSNQTAEARVALAGAGLLGNNQPGFELFEHQKLGESNFQQQVTYQRALQGQLEETINSIQGVSGAQVELVLPSSTGQVFGEGQTSSAAVLLSGTSTIDPTSVRGIAQLVAPAWRRVASRSPTQAASCCGRRPPTAPAGPGRASRKPSSATTRRRRRASMRCSARRSGRARPRCSSTRT